jgi:hypothetical protein
MTNAPRPPKPALALVAAEKGPPAKSDLAQFRETWKALSPRRRLDAIVNAPDPLRLVRMLPVQDLFATIKEVGPGDCLEVVELLHPRQVQGFFDLDGWRKDRIDPTTLGEWIEVLFAASLDRASTQLRGLDIELLSLLVKVHTRVYDIANGEDAPEDDVPVHIVTPDGRYLVVFDVASANEKLIHGLKSALEHLMGRDMQFVLKLLEAVRWEMPSSLEEEAFRWRNGRLADMGFLDPGEAQLVFAWVDPDGPMVGQPVKVPPLPRRADDEGAANLATSVLLPWSLLDGGSDVLARALSVVDTREKERIAHELMLTTNRVHLAEGGDLGDTAAIAETARRVTDTLGIALSYRTQGDVARLGDVVRGAPVQWLFRVGMSLTLRLASELRTRMKQKEGGLTGQALLRLDSPLREAAAGLLRRRPLYFAGLDDASRVDFTHFPSLPAVAETARALSEAAFRAALIGERGLGVTDAVLTAGGADPARGPSMGMLLASALLQQMEGAPFLAKPLDGDALVRVKARLEDGRFPLELRARALDALSALARGLAPLPGASTADEAFTRARAYGDQALRAVEGELAGINEAPDPRFIASLWTTGNGRREEEPEPAENNDDGRPPEEMLSADDDDFLLAHGHLFSRAREFAHLDDAGDDDFDHDA